MRRGTLIQDSGIAMYTGVDGLILRLETREVADGVVDIILHTSVSPLMSKQFLFHLIPALQE